jgi:hypothetical protein
MLYIYRNGIDKIDEDKLVHDVELEFDKIGIVDSLEVRQHLEDIEHAKYNDINSFIDRFGFKLYSEYLSTGCKAAILVSSLPDKIIDTIECGPNAIVSIVMNCRKGSILVKGLDLYSGFGDNPNAEIYCDGKTFHGMIEFNRYINGDY